MNTTTPIEPSPKHLDLLEPCAELQRVLHEGEDNVDFVAFVHDQGFIDVTVQGHEFRLTRREDNTWSWQHREPPQGPLQFSRWSRTEGSWDEAKTAVLSVAAA